MPECGSPCTHEQRAHNCGITQTLEDCDWNTYCFATMKQRRLDAQTSKEGSRRKGRVLTLEPLGGRPGPRLLRAPLPLLGPLAATVAALGVEVGPFRELLRVKPPGVAPLCAASGRTVGFVPFRSTSSFALASPGIHKEQIRRKSHGR